MQFQGFFVLLCYRDDFSVFCMVQRCLIRAQNINFYLSSAPVSDPVFRNFYFSIQFFFSFLSRCSVASDNTSMINLGTPRKFVALRFLMSQLMETSGITGLSPFSCCLKTTHLFSLLPFSFLWFRMCAVKFPPAFFRAGAVLAAELPVEICVIAESASVGGFSGRDSFCQQLPGIQEAFLQQILVG